MGKIILAPKMETPDGPLVYLFGPVYEDLDWQSDAIIHLSANPGVDVVSPRWSRESGKPETEEEIKSHLSWEKNFIEIAQKRGVICAWFPKHLNKDGGSTSLALGLLLMQKQISNFHFVIGIEPTRPDSGIFKTRILELDPNQTFCNSLSEACERALSLFQIR